MADPAALFVSRGQLGSGPVPAVQFALYGLGPAGPVRRRLGDVAEVGHVHCLQAGLAEQVVQLAAGREVVALRRVVQLGCLGQVDQQADPSAGADDAAELAEHGPLGGDAGRGAQHAQAPGQVGGRVAEGQGGRVGLEDRGAEEPGRRAARIRLGFGQDGLRSVRSPTRG
jgi:hypothetical protein